MEAEQNRVSKSKGKFDISSIFVVLSAYSATYIHMPSTEILHYLSQTDREAVEQNAENLAPLIEKHPLLRSADLVVEGGVGTNVAMAHMVRVLFPGALYIGTDLAPRLANMWNGGLRGAISERALRDLLEEHEHPTFGRKNALYGANCFDYPLVADISRKTARRTPILVTHNAFGALTDKKNESLGQKS